MLSLRNLFLGGAICCLLQTQALLGAIIIVGDVQVAPDTAINPISFYATGNESVIGLEFDIQIGDGGVDLGGDDIAPKITSILLKNGALFDLPAGTQTDVVTFDLARQSSIDLSSGSVSLTGTPTLIATVNIDTTGFFSGTFDLLLSGVAGSFDTSFLVPGNDLIPATITNGTLTVVPEPGTYAALFAGVGSFVLMYRRKRSS